VSNRAEDLETLLTRIPDPAIRALFTPEFILCCESFDRFTTETVVQLVRELELEPDLREGATVARLVREKGWAPRAHVPLSWFFRKLEAAGLLEESGGAEPEYRLRGPLPVGDPDRA